MSLTVSRLATTLVILFLAVPVDAEAQGAGKVYRIAIVHPALPVGEMTEGGERIYSVFFSELRRLGFEL